MRASSRGGGGKTPAPGMYPAGVSQSPTRFTALTALITFGTLSVLCAYAQPEQQVNLDHTLSLISNPCTGASAPAGAAVLALCTLHGDAWLLQPLHGHARARHDANGHATPQHGPPKSLGGCSSAWVQQPPSVSTAAYRCCSCPQPQLLSTFTSISYRQTFISHHHVTPDLFASQVLLNVWQPISRLYSVLWSAPPLHITFFPVK